jgi:hypothetical protein
MFGKKTEEPVITNPHLDVEFYETMPGRASLGNTQTYIKGILEIGEKELIIHKKSYFRGKDRGTKNIRYDSITSADFDAGRFLSYPSIQIYLSSLEYSFRSLDKRLKDFYDIIRNKVDKAQTNSNDSCYSSLDELKKLAELKDMGAITEEEYNLKKQQLLGL